MGRQVPEPTYTKITIPFALRTILTRSHATLSFPFSTTFRASLACFYTLALPPRCLAQVSQERQDINEAIWARDTRNRG